jgi:hypothetical protein
MMTDSSDSTIGEQPIVRYIACSPIRNCERLAVSCQLTLDDVDIFGRLETSKSTPARADNCSYPCLLHGRKNGIYADVSTMISENISTTGTHSSWLLGL